MPTPDRPHFQHPEGENRTPRPGIRMTVQLFSDSGRFLRVNANPFLHDVITARLSLEDNRNVFTTKYSPEKFDEGFNSFKAAGLTAYTFLLDADINRFDPRYADDISTFVQEVKDEAPMPTRATLLENATHPDEVYDPTMFGSEYAFHFLLTRKQSQRRSR